MKCFVNHVCNRSATNNGHGSTIDLSIENLVPARPNVVYIFQIKNIDKKHKYQEVYLYLIAKSHNLLHNCEMKNNYNNNSCLNITLHMSHTCH